jgi:putative ABC transport system permease protein
VAGLLLFGVGGTLLLGQLRGWHSGPALGLLPSALGLLLAGSVLIYPLLLPLLLQLLGRLPLRVEGRLALQQLARHRTRTGLTAGILFLTLTATAGFGQTLRGILRDVRRGYHRTIVADFLICGSMPDSSFVLATALAESLTGEQARLDGVDAVERIVFVPEETSDRPVLVLARTFPGTGPLPLDLREGEADSVWTSLSCGEVILGTGLAEQLNLHRGDVMPLNTPHGPVQLRVCGTAAEFAGGGAALYMEWQTARQLHNCPGVLQHESRPPPQRQRLAGQFRPGLPPGGTPGVRTQQRKKAEKGEQCVGAGERGRPCREIGR